MGKPLSEEAKQKISEAFARRRELKEKGLPLPVNPRKRTTSHHTNVVTASVPKLSSNMVTLKMDDQQGHIEMGKKVQEGRARFVCFASDLFYYSVN